MAKAIKAMRAMRVMKAMKAIRATKRVSIIVKGSRAKAALMRNRRNKIVTKKPASGNNVRGWRRSLAELVACNGELCLGRHIPIYNFDQKLLTYWRSKQLSADIHCARCYIRSDTCNRKMAGSTKEY